jgi:hypothetical protein
VEVVHLEWNPNLKRAWAASGVASLYAVGSPFRDEDQPNKKRVIPSDTQGGLHLPGYGSKWKVLHELQRFAQVSW